MIQDGVTGFICDPDDIAGMAERSVTLLRDPELRRKIGRAAAADVARRFCTGIIVPQYERYYEDVLTGRVHR